MDRDRFDALARQFAASPSRRGFLAALLGAGMARAVGDVEAKRNGKRRSRKRARNGRVAAQAVNCATLASGQDVSGCDYTGEDHSGENLSSAKMIKTVFRDATLVETNLHSANMLRANFRGADLTEADLRSGVLEGATLREADLCGADLRSAVVRHATFRDANLTRADLKHATGCGTATFTAGTTFCATRMCDGSIRNGDCPGGSPANACCADPDCPTGTCCGAGAARVCCPAEEVCGIVATFPTAEGCCREGGVAMAAAVCDLDTIAECCYHLCGSEETDCFIHACETEGGVPRCCFQGGVDCAGDDECCQGFTCQGGTCQEVPETAASRAAAADTIVQVVKR
jgi:hypothetical protein